MGESISDTQSALAGTEEALVLGFYLNETTAEFELICEFWGRRADAARAFALFRFSGVQQFKRRPGAYEKLRKIGTTFVARDVKGTWDIQAIRSGMVGTLKNISISLGHSFGSIAFRYEDVTHEVVHLYAKRTGPSDWDYFEVGTNRLVDFYNPFDRPWAR